MMSRAEPAKMKLYSSRRPAAKGGRGADGQAKLSDTVYDYVVDQIRLGHLTPSTKISPRDLARELSVSQMPVRDAMERLEAHGWIERFPQRGTYIKRFDVDEIREIYELREMMEAEAVQIVAQRITPEQASELEAIAEELEAASLDNRAREYQELDVRFHARLVQLVGNQRLSDFFESILLQSICLFHNIATRVTEDGPDCERTPASHRQICKALRAGNAKKAEQRIRQHISIAAEWNKAFIRIQQLSQPD